MGDACVFEFMSEPSYGRVGQSGGRSLSVFADGRIVRRRFYFDYDEPELANEELLATVPELADAVMEIVRRHSPRLEPVPEYLDDGSFDGSYYVFRFGGKRIRALNIHRPRPRAPWMNPLDEQDSLREIFTYQNLVLDAYDEIAAKIRSYGIPSTEKDLPDFS